MAGRKKKADTELILALAYGASPEQAAQKTGLGLRTVYRRLTDRGFCAQVSEVRTEMMRRTAAMFNAAAMGSLKTLTMLRDSANSESVRLGAARIIVELGCKIRDSVELSERMEAMEKGLRQLFDQAANGEQS